MDISTLIFDRSAATLADNERKIPWDEPAFSQRMLENHLSQEHDWASRRLPVIERQIEWIARQLAPAASVLDLGCGPGLYTQRLAQRGFHCTGIDFSPAAIHYAREQALACGLEIHYQQQDVRNFSPDSQFDFIMMTFGELNVFSATEVKMLLARCRRWLTPGGQLLLEVHTWDEVRRQGLAAPQWQRCPQGLFLSRPHLLLTEHAWDEAAHTSSTRFWVMEEQGEVMRFGSQMTAWRDDEYRQLLHEAGFHHTEELKAGNWAVSATFEGKLFALLAQVGE
ncbi:class I SAM-dependent methyltransferase [Enterobacteriaceae bacterium 4M9]|nr:class I SAM-dependent methyltransferase [Enterobacteriaceae bacterium 4M9]